MSIFNDAYNKLKSGWESQGVHTGSWGLPDFGVTEAFAGDNRTSEGGSNLIGQQPAQTTSSNTQWPMSYPQNTSGDVLGATTEPQPTSQTPKVDRSGTQNVDYYINEFGERVDMKPQGTSSDDELRRQQEEAQRKYEQEVENIFGEVNSYLDNAKGTLQSSLDSLNQDIGSQLGTNKQVLGSSRDQANRTLGEQGIGAEQRNLQNQAASTRLFNELQTGGRQRFGGSTSAGQAFTELNNMEMQRRSGQNAEQYGETVREIEREQMRVGEEYNNGLQQLQQQASMAKNEAQRDFNNKLLEIDKMRADAAQNKGAMKLQALQDLRNQMFQIQVQERQYQQQLDAARQQMQMELQARQQQLTSSAQTGQQAFGNMQTNTTVNPQTGLGVNSPTSSGQMPQYTGMINRDDKYPIGRISPMEDRGALTPELSNLMLIGQGQQPRY